MPLSGVIGIQRESDDGSAWHTRFDIGNQRLLSSCVTQVAVSHMIQETNLHIFFLRGRDALILMDR